MSRVVLDGDSREQPLGDSIDVIEAYWSPINKGHTHWFSVLSWLAGAIFTPLDTTARLIAPAKKTLFDYAYIGGALVLAFALFGLSLYAVVHYGMSLLSVTGLSNGGAVTAGMMWLLIGSFGGYLVAQALRGLATIISQRTELAGTPSALVHRTIAIAVLTLVGSVLILGMMRAHFPGGELGWSSVLLLLLIFVAFELGRAILTGFLNGIFGDVQVYTTHDENCHFFDLRRRILDLTVETMLRVISPSLDAKAYDDVIILAHSLGSTVSMDALLRLYQLREQGALPPEDFAKIRAFVTFGAALEKTRFFFDVARTNEPEPYERWHQDVLGLLFTDNPAVLRQRNTHAIFWANYWYFVDPICNAIASFRSHLFPGDALDDAERRRSETGPDAQGRLVCRNVELTGSMHALHPLVHGDYLDDPSFWTGGAGIGVLQIVESLS